ncbi:accessory Sec system protein Asp2 [uncultured Limosilactobacillus sp.]|uniref:accessory Sec system protein Asp2 n=1 Tax=uncultured Limosilactobacillus sp. TaxID=2837629 RepID=UPI0025D7A883|nr:accessory Sec system protein Asp2 [uncultured Limosilactobacillus sp.]
MIVLQLGNQNWQDQFDIPQAIKWVYNQPDYFAKLPKPKRKNGKPKKRQKFFNMVLVTAPVNLTDDEWARLQWKIDPYRVLYTPGVYDHLSPAGQSFLLQNRAKLVQQTPQETIADLDKKYFTAEHGGFKMPPHHLIINRTLIQDGITYPDPGHVTVHVNAEDWQTLGNYREDWYIAPHRQMKVWLEFSQNVNVVVRLRVFATQDGQRRQFILDLDSRREPVIPLAVQDYGQFISVAVEVRGLGDLTIGYVHGRWSRYGVGHYIPGGQRLIDPENNEEIPYYFNPGDGQPPLNVYFSGVSMVEAYEGKNMLRRAQAPSLAIFDPRLSLGQFYFSANLEKRITQLIQQTLANLGFNHQQLVVMGISAGSYAAVKLGAPLQPKAIIVGKLLANLGHIAARGRLHRPDDFQASYDIVTRIMNNESNIHDLQQLNDTYWRVLSECDLSQTKLFVTYMKSDNFDDQSFARFAQTPAVKASEEFAYQGYPGRHNDNSYAISNWFKRRLDQVLHDDFGREVK